MNCLTNLIAICCLTLTAKARPGYDYHGSYKLEGIPDVRDYSSLKFPKYDILDLGEYTKGHLPADEIHESKHVVSHEPEPYPVKVPIPQPYPVQVDKPYPIIETKYVKVPHAVPYEIVKEVPVPVEVPKPYPIAGNQEWQHDSYQAGSQQSYDVEAYGNELENSGQQHLNSYEDQGSNNGDYGNIPERYENNPERYEDNPEGQEH